MKQMEKSMISSRLIGKKNFLQKKKLKLKNGNQAHFIVQNFKFN